MSVTDGDRGGRRRRRGRAGGRGPATPRPSSPPGAARWSPPCTMLTARADPPTPLAWSVRGPTGAAHPEGDALFVRRGDSRDVVVAAAGGADADVAADGSRTTLAVVLPVLKVDERAFLGLAVSAAPLRRAPVGHSGADLRVCPGALLALQSSPELHHSLIFGRSRTQPHFPTRRGGCSRRSEALRRGRGASAVSAGRGLDGSPFAGRLEVPDATAGIEPATRVLQTREAPPLRSITGTSVRFIR